jgi:alkanesulfonate monooxygenase SsuD/methylene tetrahydromethanopterin reductase-like flavin-dependent oxidoreductase (luciferase family)
MAAIAGRHGDGFNTQAFSPRLADLAKVARDAHTASARAGSAFLMTVFAALEERWLRPDSHARQMLARVGVDRLILLVSPPFDPAEIRAAARLLTA